MEKKTAAAKASGNSALKVTLIVILVVAVLAGAAVYVLNRIAEDKEERRQAIINSGVFHEGITVGGVDVSGMSMDEAKAALKNAEEALTADVALSVTDGEHSYDVPHDLFIITYDTDAKLEEAMAIGREGDLETLETLIADIAQNGRSFDINYDVKPGDFANFVAGIAAELDLAPIDAAFSVKQLEMNDTTDALNAADLGVAEGDTTTDLRDLRFDFVEGTEGRCVNTEQLTADMTERVLNREYGEVRFDYIPSYPNITVATIKESLVLRASAFTSFGRGHYDRDTRVHNMKKAVGLIYGTVLQPGDVLSCNTLLGDRYEKYGWQLAPAVIEGGANTEDQPGGGVCQVSTTMYNAVLKGDYEIVYRQPHSSRLSYVDGGFDATINTRTIDFQWKNNTEAPLYVFTWMDTKEKLIWCEIYGLPFSGDFDEIELLSERQPDIAPTAPEFVELSTLYSPYWMLKNESKSGYVYDTYKIYKLAGAEVRRDKIGTTTYKMHPTRYYVWPGYIPGTPLLAEYKLTPPEE